MLTMRVPFFLIAACVFAATVCQAQAPAPLAMWVQLGAISEARALVNGTVCPTLLHDGSALAMQQRTPATAGFPLLCSVENPANTKSLLLDGKSFPVPMQNPHRILVVGDTGCRVKDSELQACNDARAWVFPKLAAAAAALKPDLAIHVGDYVSREGMCPPRFAGCQGSPFGDNWPAWQADFFSPAAPLLAAAPIILTRGNHEDCTREGLGWLRLMSPQAFDPQAPCTPHMPPLLVPLGDLTLAVVDTASAPETELVPDMAAAYGDDLASLAKIPAPVFLVQHRPIWGAVAGPLDIPVGGNLTLSAGVNKSGIPGNIDLMLSGHIHGFEAMNYYDGFPPQIVTGNGGDLLHDIPRLVKGAIFQGVVPAGVKDGIAYSGWGFLLMTRSADGWQIDTYDADGKARRHCQLKNRRIECAA